MACEQELENWKTMTETISKAEKELKQAKDKEKARDEVFEAIGGVLEGFGVSTEVGFQAGGASVKASIKPQHSAIAGNALKLSKALQRWLGEGTETEQLTRALDVVKAIGLRWEKNYQDCLKKTQPKPPRTPPQPPPPKPPIKVGQWQGTIKYEYKESYAGAGISAALKINYSYLETHTWDIVGPNDDPLAPFTYPNSYYAVWKYHVEGQGIATYRGNKPNTVDTGDFSILGDRQARTIVQFFEPTSDQPPYVLQIKGINLLAKAQDVKWQETGPNGDDNSFDITAQEFPMDLSIRTKSPNPTREKGRLRLSGTTPRLVWGTVAEGYNPPATAEWSWDITLGVIEQESLQ